MLLNKQAKKLKKGTGKKQGVHKIILGKELSMKKTILYLSLLSTFAVFNAVAMEKDRETLQAENSSLIKELETVETEAAIALSRGDEEIARLEKALANMTEETNKEKETNKALKRSIDARTQEQAEQRELLKDVLQQQNQWIPQEVPPLPPANHIITEIAGTSTYQQLLSQWQQGKIGPKAWAALNGKNRSLIAELLKAIQGYPGQNLEIIYINTESFKLWIGVKTQSKLYKF